MILNVILGYSKSYLPCIRGKSKKKFFLKKLTKHFLIELQFHNRCNIVSIQKST